MEEVEHLAKNEERRQKWVEYVLQILNVFMTKLKKYSGKHLEYGPTMDEFEAEVSKR